MRHFVGQHEMGVDPGAAILQARGRRHRAADIRVQTEEARP
jgi:choline dehydrogenase-like flavoprotein